MKCQLIVGLPAIAVSIRGDEGKDCAAAAAFIRELLEQLHAKQMLKAGLFLNVNVPAGERKGVGVTRLSVKPRHDSFERRVSPSGRLYFWPAWKQLEDDAEGADVWACWLLFSKDGAQHRPAEVPMKEAKSGTK